MSAWEFEVYEESSGIDYTLPSSAQLSLYRCQAIKFGIYFTSKLA